MTESHEIFSEVMEGRYGPLLRLRSPWRPELAHLMRDHGILGLEVNWAFLDFENVEFVCEVPHVQELIVTTIGPCDPSPIQCMHELRHLTLDTFSSARIDFRSFPMLQSASVEWRNGLKSVLKVAQLSELAINRFPKSLTEDLACLTNLRKLQLLSCGAQSLDVLRSHKKLEYLRLARFRKLKSCEFLSDLTNLRELWVQNCSGFYDLEPLRELGSLEIIILVSLGTVKSLRPLEGLTNLRKISFGRADDLEDANLAFVKNLPNLEWLRV